MNRKPGTQKTTTNLVDPLCICGISKGDMPEIVVRGVIHCFFVSEQEPLLRY